MRESRLEYPYSAAVMGPQLYIIAIVRGSHDLKYRLDWRVSLSFMHLSFFIILSAHLLSQRGWSKRNILCSKSDSLLSAVSGMGKREKPTAYTMRQILFSYFFISQFWKQQQPRYSLIMFLKSKMVEAARIQILAKSCIIWNIGLNVCCHLSVGPDW